MRNRHNRDHPVYWPAFADILTIVVVVLICMLAVRPDDSPPPPPPPPPVDDTLPATEAEFRQSIVQGKSACLVKALRAKIGSMATIRPGPEIRICSFSSDDLSACRSALDGLLPTLATVPIDRIAAQAGLDATGIVLRASTGLNSSWAAPAKLLLAETDQRIRSQSGNAWSSLLGNQRYEEVGAPTRTSDLGIFVAVGIPRGEGEFIHQHWDNKDWKGLEMYRDESLKCKVD